MPERVDDVGGIRLKAAGDAAYVLELPASMDEETSGRAVALADVVRSALTDARDVVVGYHTVTVYIDPARIDRQRIERALRAVVEHPGSTPMLAGAQLEVPVCYGGEFGPDLAEVANATGLTEAKIIALHADRDYRVFVIGFVPGFAYMGVLAPELAGIGRRGTPRTRVPAGSVAIAGGQTGIYPIDSPGGWRILGRTPVRPFDPLRTPPLLFSPGDRVRFTPITRDEFERTSG